MELVFSIFKIVFLGFFGFVAALIVLALVFGKRIRKEWEFEAEFRDSDGREFGEFDIEKSRIQKVEADYTVKPKLRMRHPSLAAQSTVRVYLDNELVLEGTVRKAGRVMLGRDQVVGRPDEVAAGQTCRVELGSGESFSAELRPD